MPREAGEAGEDPETLLALQVNPVMHPVPLAVGEAPMVLKPPPVPAVTR